MADERAQQQTQQAVLEALAVQVAHVAPVFAVHAQLDAGQRGHQLAFDTAQVPRVDQVRLQGAQGAEHAQVVAKIFAFALVQADDFHPARLDVGVVRGIIFQADNRVPVALGGHVADQVDEPVFEAADVKLLDQMHDQARLF